MRSIGMSIATVSITLILLAVTFQPVMQVEAQAAAGACGATYTVQAGNSLTSIARTCGVTYAALRAANAGILNPDLIFPGQVLNIPTGSIPTTGGGNYTIRAGDTLWKIAQANGTTVAAILAANPAITNSNLIYAGQVILVPTGTSGGGTGIPTTGDPPTTYTIQPGDTLWDVSNRYGTTIPDLMKINPILTDMNRIYPGQVITLR